MHEGEKRRTASERPTGPDERQGRILTAIVDFEGPMGREPDTAEKVDDALASVDADTVAPSVERTIAEMTEERAGYRADWDDLPATKVFESYLDSASRESHAIQCSVNKAVDLGIVLDSVRRDFADVPESARGDLADIEAVLERQIGMNRMLSEIYTADILRRIGRKKGDESIVEAGLARMDALREKLLATLDGLESANKAKIAVTPGLDDLLRSLRASVTNAPHERLRDTLYEEIAEPYSMAIGYDIEDFNEQELREALGRLESAS